MKFSILRLLIYLGLLSVLLALYGVMYRGIKCGDLGPPNIPGREISTLEAMGGAALLTGLAIICVFAVAVILYGLYIVAEVIEEFFRP